MKQQQQQQLQHNQQNNEKRDICDGEVQPMQIEEEEIIVIEHRPPLPAKKHSSLFHNALRPNSAVRQLFPLNVQTQQQIQQQQQHQNLQQHQQLQQQQYQQQHQQQHLQHNSNTNTIGTGTTPQPLTHEMLRAFEEAKRGPLAKVVQQQNNSDTETDTIKRTIERNALRRSLIKYEPK